MEDEWRISNLRKNRWVNWSILGGRVEDIGGAMEHQRRINGRPMEDIARPPFVLHNVF